MSSGAKPNGFSPRKWWKYQLTKDQSNAALNPTNTGFMPPLARVRLAERRRQQPVGDVRRGNPDALVLFRSGAGLAHQLLHVLLGQIQLGQRLAQDRAPDLIIRPIERQPQGGAAMHRRVER